MAYDWFTGLGSSFTDTGLQNTVAPSGSLQDSLGQRSLLSPTPAPSSTSNGLSYDQIGTMAQTPVPPTFSQGPTPAPPSTSNRLSYNQIGALGQNSRLPTFSQPVNMGPTAGGSAPAPTTTTPPVAGGTPLQQPQVPTFAPSTYTQSTSPYYAGSTTQATLDSYLRNSVQSLFNPSAIENGTAMSDPTQMLTSLANNYLKLNPGAGNPADIANLVSQYAKQYTDWYNQSQQWYKQNAGSVALPGGSPFATPGSAAANTPATPSPYPYGTNGVSPTGQISNTPTSNTGNSQNISQLLQQLLGSQVQQQQYHTVRTPLGYTQYQANVPQTSQNGLDPMTQLVLSMLMGQGGGQGGSQNSFWNLLSGTQSPQSPLAQNLGAYGNLPYGGANFNY